MEYFYLISYLIGCLFMVVFLMLEYLDSNDYLRIQALPKILILSLLSWLGILVLMAIDFLDI